MGNNASGDPQDAHDWAATDPGEGVCRRRHARDHSGPGPADHGNQRRIDYAGIPIASAPIPTPHQEPVSAVRGPGDRGPSGRTHRRYPGEDRRNPPTRAQALVKRLTAASARTRRLRAEMLDRLTLEAPRDLSKRDGPLIEKEAQTPEVAEVDQQGLAGSLLSVVHPPDLSGEPVEALSGARPGKRAEQKAGIEEQGERKKMGANRTRRDFASGEQKPGEDQDEEDCGT